MLLLSRTALLLLLYAYLLLLVTSYSVVGRLEAFSLTSQDFFQLAKLLVVGAMVVNSGGGVLRTWETRLADHI